MDTLRFQKIASTIRFLAVDTVQRANSGHPGMPMGLADIMAVFSDYYRHNPKDSTWLGRDRVVFSGGHGSALIYSLLHLWGYDVSLEDLKNFRQYGSKTPGHPEFGHTHGVEVTTGPLGQGVANAVGFAMAAKRAGVMISPEAFNHKVWCFCGDGDLEEGISYEACSLAGHLGLDNMILIYDSNNITIEGDTEIALSENVKGRFESQGWDVLEIDGHDYGQIVAMFERAIKHESKPLLVIAKTKIGKGAATMEGSHHTHGSPLGEAEIAASKEKAGWSSEPFYVPQEVKFWMSSVSEVGEAAQKLWNDALDEEQKALIARLQNPDFNAISYPSFEIGKSVATRDSNHKILNAIANGYEGFFGGSADLAPSNKTELLGLGDFPKGRNIHFGIREHAMGAITNAIALYGLFHPFCATFFVFSDYVKPSLRVAALMGIKASFVFTHDSIGVGEDGPTHQPIEQLGMLRSMPGINVYRPADAEENVACWKHSFTTKEPSVFVLSRQGLTIFDKSESFGSVANGAYRIKTAQNAKVTLLSSGSEVAPCLEAAEMLATQGIIANVVSAPCFDVLCTQDKSYIKELFGDTFVVAVEAARGLEWHRFADIVLGMEHFGASGKDKVLFEVFGFTAQKIAEHVVEAL